jgi:hypothetical protein
MQLHQFTWVPQKMLNCKHQLPTDWCSCKISSTEDKYFLFLWSEDDICKRSGLQEWIQIQAIQIEGRVLDRGKQNEHMLLELGTDRLSGTHETVQMDLDASEVRDCTGR